METVYRRLLCQSSTADHIILEIPYTVLHRGKTIFEYREKFAVVMAGYSLGHWKNLRPDVVPTECHFFVVLLGQFCS